jgi:hypothetical protein
MLDIIKQMLYNIITGKGQPSTERKENKTAERRQSRGRRTDEKTARATGTGSKV